MRRSRGDVALLLVLAAVLVLVSCGSSGGSNGGAAKSGATSTTSRPEGQGTSKPGASATSTSAPSDGAAAAMEVDLAGQTEDDEIATLLDFQTGAGDTGTCDNYGYADEYYAPVAQDVAVSAGSDGTPRPGAIGWPEDICVGGVDDQVTGTVTPPGGPPLELGPLNVLTRSGTVAVVQWEPLEGVSTISIITYPGAPTGSYRVAIEGRSPFDLELRTAVDADAQAVAFQYGSFSGEQDVRAGDDVELGFVGQAPGATGTYFLFRADQTDGCCLPSSTYALVDRVEVGFDARGEAARRISTRSSPPNSCFVLLERSKALAKIEDGDGLVYISGSEPASWCVGTAVADGVVADGCGDLDEILSYEGPPAGGRTFCTDSHGVILGYYASNYGLSVLALRNGVWTSVAEFNLGERPLIDAMVEAGIPDDDAAALCAAIPEAEDGLDPGC